MKERPILFSGAMVRAILAGTKTQTRRICKGARELSRAADWPLDKSPYGQAGHRLWVRETFFDATALNEGRVLYRARGDQNRFDWRPSIFMPRWASRITLEITGVRVERLQSISAADAIAEGVEPTHIDMLKRQQYRMVPHREYDIEDGRIIGAVEYIGRPTTCRPVEAFQAVWQSVNAKRAPWASNPWVWVIEFKRING